MPTTNHKLPLKCFGIRGFSECIQKLTLLHRRVTCFLCVLHILHTCRHDLVDHASRYGSPCTWRVSRDIPHSHAAAGSSRSCIRSSCEHETTRTCSHATDERQTRHSRLIDLCCMQKFNASFTLQLIACPAGNAYSCKLCCSVLTRTPSEERSANPNQQ